MRDAMKNRKIYDAATLREDLQLSADVLIVGTGAGGGYSAEVLTQAGLSVIMVEEGRYHTARTFVQNDAKATSMLYQEAGTQRTKDQAITVLQGRAVGGGTTVNWTTCLAPPEPTLKHWQEVYGLSAMNSAELAPYLAEAGQRLHVNAWTETAPNANNDLLGKACAQLGYHHGRVPRNVKNCHNTGQCGNGCPVNAKQSQLVTTIPWALDHGAQLVVGARVERIVHNGRRAQGVEAVALDAAGVHSTGRSVHITARHIVLSAGAIRSPALLMRSKVPDASGKTGRHTFLHPVTLSVARFKDPVQAFYGAPQTVYSEHFMWPDGRADSGKLGFKVETIPLLPLGAAALIDKTFGAEHAQWMKQLPHLQCIDALGRDGFHTFEPGGTVELADGGRPVLDYVVNDFLIRGQAYALAQLMELQFAAGALEVRPAHMDQHRFSSMAQARQWLAQADMGPLKLLRGSAHVMGGCRMGPDAGKGVVDTWGRHYGLVNVSVHDASIFPTSIGLNPQMTIYATALRNARHLAQDLQST